MREVFGKGRMIMIIGIYHVFRMYEFEGKLEMAVKRFYEREIGRKGSKWYAQMLV